MAPPWVTFDSSALYDGNCGNGVDPDIARLGVRESPSLHSGLLPADPILIQVVLSFVFASVMTTFASVLAMVFAQAFDSKGRFTPRAPVKYVRE